MNCEDHECWSWETWVRAHQPATEVKEVIYALADIMADAPEDAEGYRRMAEGALMIRLLEKSFLSPTAVKAIGWAAEFGFLREVARRPTIYGDTVTLRKLATGQLEAIFGSRPYKAAHGPEHSGTETVDALSQLRATYATAMDENGEHIVAIAADAAKSADERMRRISEIDRRVCAWTSSRWADLLRVSASAIRQTGWWKVDRVRYKRPE